MRLPSPGFEKTLTRLGRGAFENCTAVTIIYGHSYSDQFPALFSKLIEFYFVDLAKNFIFPLLHIAKHRTT